MITYRMEYAIPYGRTSSFTGSNSGDPMRRTYKKIYETTATHERQPRLVEDSASSMADYINSFADECDIHNILLRYSCGDINVLNARQGFYMDISAFPADRSKSVSKATSTISDAIATAIADAPDVAPANTDSEKDDSSNG